MTEDQQWLCEVNSTRFSLISLYHQLKTSGSDNGSNSVNSLRAFLLILLCFYENMLSLWLTCASAVVYLLMDLSSDDASVCLSVTPFSGFHPIKSWLKRWQTWHTLFIILMSRLSLPDELKASRSPHNLQTDEYEGPELTARILENRHLNICSTPA